MSTQSLSFTPLAPRTSISTRTAKGAIHHCKQRTSRLSRHGDDEVAMHTPGGDRGHARTRRRLLQIAFAAAVFPTQKTKQAIALPSPFAKPLDLVERVGQRAPPRPSEKLFQADLYYPDYFAGVWKTESKLVSVTCPAGYKLFGRPGSFEAAQRDVNHVLEYPSRFIRFDGHVISDRAFNVKAIAEASMGKRSVLDCSQPRNNPDRLMTVIRPSEASGDMFRVSMKALSRQQQEGRLSRAVGVGSEEGRDFEDGIGLYTSEMVRQEVRLDTENLRVKPLIREVETTTLFVISPRMDGCIEAWQKTSSYLTRADLMYVDAKGRPIDVRWYQLRYLRRAV